MPPPPPPDAAGNAPARPARRPARLRGSVGAVALALAAMLVGGGIVFAMDRHATAGAGEQHVQGTVSAKTATTVTVRSASGTATYTVNDSTQIVRDGQTATLAAVQVGDLVLVHVYPSSSGQLLVERLFAGSSAGDGGPGGFGLPGLGPPGLGPPGSGSGSTGSQSGGLTT